MQKPRILLAVLVIGGVLLAIPGLVAAQDLLVASESGDATEAAEIATPAAEQIVQQVTEKKPDITEIKGPTVGKLGQYLIDQPWEPVGITNFVQYAIRLAILSGVPASTIVLIILFPLVAAIIAGARHLIGLRGFGIFTPAVLSVAFVATGIFTGILLFLVILGVATLGKNILKKAKLQYLPRMALLLWFVCVGVLVVLLIGPILGIEALVALSIFPILMLILLAETFIEVQIGKSRQEAMQLTVETIVLALISSLVLSLEMVQKFALVHPELLLILVLVIDVFMGRYVGLRYTEYKKFKKIIE